MKRLLHVVGARPNFMKIAPIIEETARYPHHFEQILVHTGQHYDASMSQVFFDELEMPTPDVNLEVGSSSHAQQTAQIMQRFEPVLQEYEPDWLVVPGDVNSTVACALVASKLGIKVAHVEAGLRSFDRTMPEEINRIVTDHLSELLFTTERSGNKNLMREGISENKIRFVGNTMIDTLVRLMPRAQDRWLRLQNRFGLERYVLVTLHRPSNVDARAPLYEIMSALKEIIQQLQVIFPVHPRTRRRIADLVANLPSNNLLLVEPMGYLDFLALEAHASLVVTDSGGVQEETTYLNVPCLTVRQNTERPITVQIGTNQLVAPSCRTLIHSIKENLSYTRRPGASAPEYWDGHAAMRIVGVLGGMCQ